MALMVRAYNNAVHVLTVLTFRKLFDKGILLRQTLIYAITCCVPRFLSFRGDACE